MDVKDQNFHRNRRNKRWSDEEIEHLLLGLMKYGLSSWTTICQRWNFEDRTTVDLKDKWRNLVSLLHETFLVFAETCTLNEFMCLIDSYSPFELGLYHKQTQAKYRFAYLSDLMAA